MPARQPISLRKQTRNVFVLILIGVLFLTSSAFVKPQAQGQDPLQKRMQPGGIPLEAVSSAEKESQPADKTNPIQDPGFEASFGSEQYWEQSSTWFSTPLCTLAACGNGSGTARPRTGSVWSWFGGVSQLNESASLEQYNIPFPACGAKLQFYFWIGAARSGSDINDRFFIMIDNVEVFSINATQRGLYTAYTLVTVDVSAYADGMPHNLRMSASTSQQLVTFNLDDISLISGPCVTISGNIGEPTLLSYKNVIDQTTWADANGDYSIQVPLHWSGTVVTPFISYDKIYSPASRTYTNVTTNQMGQNFTPLLQLSGSLGVPGATLSYIDGVPKTVTSDSQGRYDIWMPLHWSGTITPSHPCFNFDPVSRSYTNFSAPDHLGSYTASFNTGASCANINVRIHLQQQGHFGVPSGESTRASFSGVNNGPVKIESTNLVPIIGAERLIYKVSNVPTSFIEMMGLPDGQLDNTYWLLWYNNVDLDTQLRFANVTGSPLGG